MTKNTRFTVLIALIVALGGFLMGFDASVISGVVKFIEPEFNLTKIELGWSVASLALTATLAMMIAGPLSDRLGRKLVLKYAAVLFAISAIASALAPSFLVLVIARMIGGFGVGAALIIAPMYIAEVSPAHLRGRMVSFNQLNIVIGISVAFFTNYLILKLSQSDASWAQALHFEEWNWRWMLGLETLPAILYFFSLFIVPESPRWLIMKGRDQEALATMIKISGEQQALLDLKAVHDSTAQATNDPKLVGEKILNPVKRIMLVLKQIGELFKPSMRLVITIGIIVAVVQQITGINSVFFYAPIIFEQSGIGTDASFVQAIFVGLINLAFTLLAIALIDKLGRKPLLGFGVTGIAICMFVLAYGFNSASYTLSTESIKNLPEEINKSQVQAMVGTTYSSDLDFKKAIKESLGEVSAKKFESELITAAIDMNPTLILFGILGFVACFAVSIGPVMWVLFSELFPNQIRGVAISFVGLINSAISFLVQLVFPWELANIGSAGTFLIYGIFAAVGVILIMILLPETKGKSLEELEATLVKN